MGLPVTVYRYTDAGAPQLTNGTPSEWIDILKKVLVDGYGSKAPLGWTLEFENAGQYKAAFRNKVADGGTGGYVQFWSSTGGNAANTGMNLVNCASMAALDSFIRPGYGRQLNITTGFRGWEIIGTSRGFYIILHYTTSLLMGVPTSSYVTYQTYFVGDIHSYIANDTGAFTIASSSAASDQYGTSSAGIISNQTSSVYCRLYDTDGGSGQYMYTASKPHPQALSLDGDAESLGVNHLMVPFELRGVVTNQSSISQPYVRGIIPGLHMSSFCGYRTQEWPKELLDSDSIKWLLLRNYYSTSYWIKTGTWYD
ncbi:hypothetical protein [Shewanella baltica]|uniref:hypothetical protein n=1 Tax=Shewanella baltica TaxID=62322 RepID=UPI00217D93BF|nr:hypothetical protein [Shewanella baltica]MCS6175849.1 hypothetical protein [Shewanella baltica]